MFNQKRVNEQAAKFRAIGLQVMPPLVVAFILSIAISAMAVVLLLWSIWFYPVVSGRVFVEFASVYITPALAMWLAPLFLYVTTRPAKYAAIVFAVSFVLFLFVCFELASALYGIFAVWTPGNTSNATFTTGVYVAAVLLVIMFVVGIVLLVMLGSIMCLAEEDARNVDAFYRQLRTPHIAAAAPDSSSSQPLVRRRLGGASVTRPHHHQ